MKFFLQLKESVVDFKFYKEIKNNTFDKSFVYFLVLFVVLYSMNSVGSYVTISKALDTAVVELNEQVPDFVLEDGKLDFKGEMPFYLMNEENQIIVVDTTGQLTEDVLDEVYTGFLLTEDKLYAKSGAQQNSIRYSDFPDLALTKPDLLDFLSSIRGLVVITMLVGFIFVLGWKLLNAAILALIGAIFSSAFYANLKYKELFNFAIYALTLPLLLQTAVGLSRLPIPYFGIVYWAVSIIYIAMAVRSYKISLNTTGSNSSDSGTF